MRWFPKIIFNIYYMNKIKKVNELNFSKQNRMDSDINDVDFVSDFEFEFYLLESKKDTITEYDRTFKSKVSGICISEKNNYIQTKEEDKSILSKIFKFNDVDKVVNNLYSKTFYLDIFFDEQVPFSDILIEIGTLILDSGKTEFNNTGNIIKFLNKTHSIKFTNMCKRYCEKAIKMNVLPKKLKYKESFNPKNFLI